MNNWDDNNNLPPDDENDDVFGWLDDDDQDNTSSEKGGEGGDDLTFNWEDSSEGDSFDFDDSGDDFSFDWQETPAEEETPQQEEWKMQRPNRLETDFERTMEDAEEADIGDVESILDWMATEEEPVPAAPTKEPAAPLDLPDWLQGMEIPEASETPAEDPALQPSPVEGSIESDYEIDFAAGVDSDDDGDADWLEELAGFGSSEESDKDTDMLGQLVTGGLGDDDDFSRLNKLAQTDELHDPDTDLLGDLATGELADVSAGDTGGFDWGLGEASFEEEVEFESFEEQGDSGADDWGTGGFEDFGGFEEQEQPTASGADDWGTGGFEDLSSFESAPAETSAPEPAAEDADPWGGTGDFESIDWETPLEPEPEEPAPAEEADWLAGLELPEEPEEENTESLDDALNALFAAEAAESAYDDPEPEPLLSDEEADWMQGLELAEDSAEEPTAPTGVTGSLEDLLADLDDSGAGETEGVDDLLSELGEFDEDSTSLDDLLAGLEDEGEAEPSSLDDLLSELDAADVTEESFPQEPVAGYEDLSEALPPQEDDALFDDLFAGLDDTEAELDDEPALELNDADWLSELDAASDELVIDSAEPEGFLDADDFLATLGDSEPVIPIADDVDDEYGSVDLDADLFGDEDAIVRPSDDLDSLFAGLGAEEESLDDFAAPIEIEEDLPQFSDDAPDWLREAAGGASDVSAVGALREQKDRPLNELDERLQDLRERGLELSTSDIEVDTNLEKLEGVVPNTADALIPMKRGGTASIIAEPSLSPEQQQRAEMLRGLVTATIGEDADEAEGEPSARRQRGGLLRGYKVGRLLIAILLLAVVAIPFLTSDYNLVDLPQGTFESGSQQEQAFLRIQSLIANDPVLVAVEYGSTGARELDTMTASIFSHLFNQGAVPLLVSTDPVGLLNAENIAVDLAGEDERGVGFISAGYLPGGELGIRDLTENLNQVIGSDSRGEATGLTFTSLNDFTLIILIAENSETVRQWMEQVAPMTETDFVVATGQSASPLALPYVDSVPDAYGLLVGYEDAYTYQTMNVAFNGIPPTATPSPTATETATPDVTEEAVVPVDSTEEVDTTEEVVDGADVTEEAEATAEATIAPTDTPQPSATATDTATPQPTDTPQPTATPEPRRFARIATTGTINVRSGPGTDFDVVAGAVPNQELLILGFDDSGEWVNIELPDGGDGWVAVSLVEIFEEEPEAEGSSGILPRTFARRGAPVVAQQATPEEPTILVGINVSGILMGVYDNPDFAGEPLADLPPNTAFLVLEEGDTATRVLLEDGQEGWVESRLVRIEERPVSEVEFAPTPTFTPTVTFTPTITMTPTNTPTPTPTPFVPEVIPQPIAGASERWNAMTLGTLAALVLIFAGNVIWIIRWLRQRGQ